MFRQYPAIFVLSIIMLIVGFVRPYLDKINNYLELLLGSNVLLLLLLRNTEQLKEELKHIPLQEGQRLDPLRKCTEGVKIEGASGFAWLLFMFYYLPLLAALIGIILWIGYRIRYAAVTLVFDTNYYSNVMQICSLYAKSRRYQTKQPDPSIISALVRQPSRSVVDLGALAADIDGNTAADVDTREHDNSFKASYTMAN